MYSTYLNDDMNSVNCGMVLMDGVAFIRRSRGVGGNGEHLRHNSRYSSIVSLSAHVHIVKCDGFDHQIIDSICIRLYFRIICFNFINDLKKYR